VNIYLVVDPAREGLHKKVRNFIKSINFVNLIYCSCNVDSWMRDVEYLVTNNDIIPLQTLIVDMFPYTKHYEVLSSFIK
jgi:tRNA/tmRNA/rRNA uracil-C5-methylase (TrmA/RlmC/RlmD family)